MNEKNNKGLAMIMAVAIMGILSAIGISFAFNMKLNQKAVENYVNSKKARYLAEAGIAMAIAELKNALSLYTYDAEAQNWNSFSESIGDGNYSVTVTDESGKININNCGNLSGAVSPFHLSNEGYTTFEISLVTGLGITASAAQGIINYRHGGGATPNPGANSTDDDNDNTPPADDGIDNNGDGTIDEDLAENTDEPDEFCLTNPAGDDMPFKMIEEVNCCSGVGAATYTAIKDYITVSSYDKIQDSAGNTRVNVNRSTVVADIMGKLQSGGMTAAAANQVAVNIIDYADADNIPTLDGTYIGKEMVPFINEVMPDTSCADEQGDDGEFIELYNPWGTDIDVGGWTVGNPGSMVTIPGGTTVPANGYLIITDQYNDFDPDPEPDGTIDNEGFTDLFGAVPTAANWVEVSALSIDPLASTIELRDNLGTGNLIDRDTYGNSNSNRSQEKDDPRVDLLTELAGETGGEANSIYNPGGGEGVSTLYVKNYAMANIGEAGLIHNGGQWTTVNLKSGGDWGIIDYLTVSDPRADGFDNDCDWEGWDGGSWNDDTNMNGKPDVGEPNVDESDEINLYGRININTASIAVLQGLPGVTAGIAAGIDAYRSGNPFNTIGEILQVPEMNSLNSDSADNDGDGISDEGDENEAVFRKISNLITVRSNVFTIESTGKVLDPNNNILAEKKIRAVVDRGASPIKYLYYREVTD